MLNIILPGLNVAFQVILTPIRLLSEGIGAIAGLLNGSEVTLKSMGKLAVGLVGTFGMYRAIMLGITAQKLIQKGLDVTQASMGKGYLATLIAQAVAWTIMNPIKALVGLAVAGGVGAAIYSSMKDGVIDPSKGPILSGGFGSVQLNPKDKAMYGADGTIKVGTNLGGKGTYSLDKKDSVIAGTGLGGGKSNNSSSEPELKEIKNILRKTLDVNIEIARGVMASGVGSALAMSLDVGKLGTIIGTNTYKIQ